MLRLFVSVADAHCVLYDFDQAGLAALQSRASWIATASFKLLRIYMTREREKESTNAGWQAVSPSVISTFRIFPLTLITHKKTSAKMPTFTLTL